MDDQITNRIASWILSGGIQIQDGPEAGGVAGWLNAEGKPAFAYTEITGYYLTCMAFMHRAGRPEPEILLNAHRALTWLLNKCQQGGIPLTRYYFQDGVSDWRNDAVFSFDLAMVLRGLSSVKGMVNEDARKQAFFGFLKYLCECVSSDGLLLPSIQRNGESLPARWSTQSGPFQLKAAATLLCFEEWLPEEIKRAALNVYSKWACSTHSLLRDSDLHAALYAIEGLILLGVHGCEEAWKLAARQFQSISQNLTLPQSDVVAQSLRAGSILLSRGLLPFEPWNKKVNEFAGLLKTFVGNDGSVHYCDSLRHRNAWSALFAYQALTFYDRISHQVSVEALGSVTS